VIKEIEKPDLKNRLFKCHAKVKAGDFGEALSAINLKFTNDPAIGKGTSLTFTSVVLNLSQRLAMN